MATEEFCLFDCRDFFRANDGLHLSRAVDRWRQSRKRHLLYAVLIVERLDLDTGTLQGATLINPAVLVANGVFSVELEFRSLATASIGKP